MRGHADNQMSMLSLHTPEQMVPADHPLRAVKALADAALKDLSPVFDEMYAATGRSSVPPETLLKGSLLMALYSVRSERMLCEQLGYNMLFRWFLDMNLVAEPFDHSTFSKNRERLMEHDASRLFFERVVAQAQQGRLMSSDHFTVDGTLIEAWASLKSFQPTAEAAEQRRVERNRRKAAKQKRKGKGGKGPGGGSNPTVNFHGETRSNATHSSKTDPESKLFRKGYGKEAKLSFSAHALMENRNGLLVNLVVDEANGFAERRTALAMLGELERTDGITVGADKGYDTSDFVQGCRDLGVVPHVAQHTTNRRSRVDARTTRHPGYSISQRIRKRVEEIFGWIKTVGGFRRTRFKGRNRTQDAAYLVGAAYNLARMSRLMPAIA